MGRTGRAVAPRRPYLGFLARDLGGLAQAFGGYGRGLCRQRHGGRLWTQHDDRVLPHPDLERFVVQVVGTAWGLSHGGETGQGRTLFLIALRILALEYPRYRQIVRRSPAAVTKVTGE